MNILFPKNFLATRKGTGFGGEQRDQQPFAVKTRKNTQH